MAIGISLDNLLDPRVGEVVNAPDGILETVTPNVSLGCEAAHEQHLHNLLAVQATAPANLPNHLPAGNCTSLPDDSERDRPG